MLFKFNVTSVLYFIDFKVQEGQFHENSEEEKKKSEVKASIYFFFFSNAVMQYYFTILYMIISFGHIKFKCKWLQKHSALQYFN